MHGWGVGVAAEVEMEKTSVREEEERDEWLGGGTGEDATNEWVVAAGVDDNRAGSESSCVQRTHPYRNGRERHRSEAEGEGSWTKRNVPRTSGEGCVANAQNACRIARPTVTEWLPGFRFSQQWDRRVLKASAAAAAASGVEGDGVAIELEGEDRDGGEGWGQGGGVEGEAGAGSPDG